MKNNIDTIQVLGSGCPTCKKLFEMTKQAVQELGVRVEVEYSTDIQKIVEMGVMQSPVLAINGKPVLVGAASDIEKVRTIISNFEVVEKKQECGCGGSC